jgi:hypothetical protein
MNLRKLPLRHGICGTIAAAFVFVWGAGSAAVQASSAEIPMNTDAAYSGRELMARGAYCWFADPRAIRQVNPASGSDKTYIGCIDTDGTVKALQIDNLTGTKIEVILDTQFQPDDHNNPTFLSLPDHRVMILWSAHTAEPRFYYRVSTRPDSIEELGERKTVSVEGYGNFTYPSPFYLTDAPDSFFLCWRGVKWHPTIARYSLPDANGEIVNELRPTQIIQSTAARPYAKYASNGKDRIFFTYTTGHPDNEFPNWVYYSELDVNTMELFDVTGEKLAQVAEQPFKVSQATARPPLVVDGPEDRKNWVWDLAMDGTGRPAIAMTRISRDARVHDYYRVSWTGSAWQPTFLGHGGGWFHQNPRGAEKCYSGGLALDPEDTGVVYYSAPADGRHGRVYEIWRAEVDAAGALQTTAQVTRHSEKNNVRPFVINRSPVGSQARVLWMNGDYYYWIVNRDNPLGFPTRIMTGDAGE